MLRISLFAMLLGSAALPALAADRPAAWATVAHADLDLTSPAGRATLDGRIRTRAKSVCRDELRGSAWTPTEMRACVTDALARARMRAERAIAQAGARSDRIVAAR